MEVDAKPGATLATATSSVPGIPASLSARLRTRLPAVTGQDRAQPLCRKSTEALTGVYIG
jgi:hypothetical protein